MSKITCGVDGLWKDFLQSQNLKEADTNEDLKKLFQAIHNIQLKDSSIKIKKLENDFLINSEEKPKREYFENLKNIVKEFIENKHDNDVLVFGSNLDGKHGLGAAALVFSGDFTTKDWQNKKDNEVGLFTKWRSNPGFNYGVMTKKNSNIPIYSYSLATKGIYLKNALPKDKIIENIRELYQQAKIYENKKFYILYNVSKDIHEKSLNGYSKKEIAEMFVDAGDIPNNIVFEKKFSLLVERTVKESKEDINKEEISKEIKNTTAEKIDENQPIMMNSGGAFGSDNLFRMFTDLYAMFHPKTVIQNHFYFAKQFPYPPHIYGKYGAALGDENFKEGFDKAVQALKNIRTNEFVNKFIQQNKDKPTNTAYLFARNWYQVKMSDQIVALGSIRKKGTKNKDGFTIENIKRDAIVDGGTGLAVEMAIQSNKPVFVYNLTKTEGFDEGWYTWNGRTFERTTIPTLTNKFAGIGTRDIEDFTYTLKRGKNGQTRKVKEFTGTFNSAIGQKAMNVLHEVYQNSFSVSQSIDKNGNIIKILPGKNEYLKIKNDFLEQKEKKKLELILNKLVNDSTIDKVQWKNQTAIAYGPIDYSYTGGKHKAKSIPSELQSYIKNIEKQLGKKEGYFNHILINKFVNNKGIPKHTDKENIYVDENGNVGSVAIYSIGNTIDVHTFNGNEVRAMDNSLVEMSTGAIEHSVASSAGTRYSFTLRHIPSNKLNNKPTIKKQIPKSNRYYDYAEKNSVDDDAVKFYMGRKEYSKNNWLSNLYNFKNPIKDKFGLEYYSVEAIYQAGKLKNKEDRVKFSGPNVTGADAKKMSKNITTKYKDNETALLALETAIEMKFVNNPDILQKLKDTGNKQLVEHPKSNIGNNEIFGIPEDTNEGFNITGKAIMRTRDEINRDFYKVHLKNKDKINSVNTDNFTFLEQKNGDIVLKNNADVAQINSYDEMINFLSEFHTLMNAKYDFGSMNKFEDRINSVLSSLLNSDIPFKKINVKIVDKITDSKGNLKPTTYGTFNRDTDTITVKTNYDDAYILPTQFFPAKVFLHELIHSITANSIKKNDAIRQRIRKLMDIFEKRNKHTQKSIKYSFTDEYEFMAEALSNPYLMEELDNIQVNKTETILDKVFKIFEPILKIFTNSSTEEKTTALQEALDIALTSYFEEINYKEETKNEDEEFESPYTLKGGFKANKQQTEAIDRLKQWFDTNDKTFVVSGYAGTGKTSTIQTAIDEIKKSNPDVTVSYLAFTNKAKEQLANATGEKAITIHNALGLIPSDEVNEDGTKDLSEKTNVGDTKELGNIAVVDESSMINDELYNDLLNENPDTKFIFLGDVLQLNPVGQETDAKAMMPEEHGDNFIQLTKVERQLTDSPVPSLIENFRDNIKRKNNSNNPSNILNNSGRNTKIEKAGSIYFTKYGSKFIAHFVNSYINNPKSTRMITFFNQNNTFSNISVYNLNKFIREIIYPENSEHYRQGDILMGYNTYKGVVNKKPITYFVNSAEYEVVDAGVPTQKTFVGVDKMGNSIEKNINGQYITIKPIEGTNQKVKTIFVPFLSEQFKLRDEVQDLFNNKMYKKAYALKNLVDNLPHLEFTYAITTYKSQGSTYDDVYVMEDSFNSKNLTNELKSKHMYVAASRTRNRLTFISNRNQEIQDLGSTNITNGELQSILNVQGSESLDGMFYDKNIGDEIVKNEEIDLSDQQSFINWVRQALIDDMSNGETNEDIMKFGNYSPEFAAIQNEFLTKFMDAFSKLSNAKITYKEIQTALNSSEGRNTAGRIIHKADGTKEIDVRWNRYRSSSRKSGIIMHELFHMLTSQAFGSNQDVKNILNQLRQAAVDAGITYEIFLQPLIENGIEISDNDIRMAKENYEYVFGENADPEEFIAYAATDELVFNAVKNLKIDPIFIDYLEPGSGNVSNKFIDFINKFIKIINKVWASLVGTKGTGAEIVADTVIKMIDLQETLNEYFVQDEQYKNSKLQEYTDKYDENMKKWINKFDSKLADLDETLDDKFSFEKFTEKLDDVAGINRIIRGHMIQNIYLQLFERTDNPDVAEIYRTFRQGKDFTERSSRFLSDAVKRFVSKKLGDVDIGTRKIINSVIFQTDLPSIENSEGKINLEFISELLNNNETIEQSIKDTKEKLKEEYKKANHGQTTDEDFENDLKQIEGLAKNMVDGKLYNGNQQLNAENIFNKFYNQIINKERKPTDKLPNNYNVIIRTMNNLITLEAIKYTPQIDKSVTYNFLQDKHNRNSVEEIMNMYKYYVTNTSKNFKTGLFNPVKKGYMAEVNNEQMKFEIIPEYDLKYYTNKIGNMKNIGEFGVINGIKYYKVVGRGHDLGYDEGIFSIAGDTIDGISVKSILLNQIDYIEKDKIKSDRLTKQEKDEMIDDIINTAALNDGKFSFMSLPEDTNLIPVYDTIGRIINYKIQLSKNEKINHMNMSNDIIETSAYTFSKMKHREAAMLHNIKAVDILMEHAKKNVAKNPDDFIIIRKFDPDVDEEYDDDIHGRWDRIPDYTRKYIVKKNGGEHYIIVPKNKIELIFGEPEASASNFNFGPIDLRKYPKIQKFIMMLEDYIAEVSAFVRETIAIKTGSVVSANTISNAIQTWLEVGINPYEYIKRVRQKWLQLDEYKELQRKLDDLHVRIVSTTDIEEANLLKKQIMSIENQLEKNSFHDLVQDGQFSPIIEDINVEEISNGHLARMIEDGLNSNNLMQKLKPMRDTLFVTRNTKLYKGMMKVTQYGDIITREIIREEKLKQNKKNSINWTQEEYQEYLDYLDQMFVNYGYINNRYLRYSERILGVFFTKYLFRQAKAVIAVAKKAPSRFTGLIGGEWLTGIDLKTADDDYWHFFEALTNRMTGHDIFDLGVEAITPDLQNVPFGIGDLFKLYGY